MSLNKDISWNASTKNVKSVQFSILGTDELRRMSVVEVVHADTTESNNEPRIAGLNDPRMGVLDFGKVCPTDGQDYNLCPGYFGHIELPRPVFHIQFLPLVMKILKCVCWRCSRILVDKSTKEFAGMTILKNKKAQFTNITKTLCNSKICFADEDNNGCGAIQPTKWVKDGISKIIAEFKVGKEKDDVKRLVFTAEMILNILKNISDEDIELLGYDPKWSRPESMICEILPVPPLNVRPYVTRDGNQRAEDDLTHKLSEIVKTSQQLEQRINSNSEARHIEELVELLQYHVATFVDNEQPNLLVATQRSGRPIKSLRQRLKGKHARIRGNLMGKRVNFSARSVITGDPCIEIDELGVPLAIAMNLTFPETVTDYNKNSIYALIKNGPYKYPGAKLITRNQQTCKGNYEQCHTYLEHHPNPENIELQDGDIVHRHLQDGDFVLFNRQPSLHRVSMMGHRVRVMKKGSSFRLNPNVTQPYNADFDGDEMNMHVPQSYQVYTELSELALVPHHVIEPRRNGPVMGAIMDTIVGSYKMTNKNTKINRRNTMQLLNWVEDFDGNMVRIKHTNNIYTGKDVYSEIIPPLSLEKDTNTGPKDDGDPDYYEKKIKVENGKIIHGVIDKATIGAKTGGLLHHSWIDYGPERTKLFMDNFNFIANYWLTIDGFSIGLEDAVAPADMREEITKQIKEAETNVANIIEQIHKGELEKTSSFNAKNDFEGQVITELNRVRNDVGNYAVNKFGDKNRLNVMIRSGSKGGQNNLAQMAACVGQQQIEGKRVEDLLEDRTLPHFHKFRNDPLARGFVKDSYASGLSPPAFWFHAMAGRIGMIDTAISTAEVGYITRRFIKATEDLEVKYDNTVRNSNDQVIQFIYGDDGFDGIRIEHQKYIPYKLSKQDFIKKYKYTDEELQKFNNIDNIEDITNKEFELLQIDRDLVRYEIFTDPNEATFMAPAPFFRIITNAKNKFDNNNNNESDITPDYVIDKVNKLTEEILELNGKDALKIEIQEYSTIIFRILLKSYLSSKEIILNHKLKKITFDWIIAEVKRHTLMGFVQPGEMVGSIASQSIGEPALQMTLNTFHHTGIASKTQTTSGPPRLKEIMSAKSLKTPAHTIYLKPDVAQDREKAELVMSELQYTLLKDIIDKTQILYDPHDFNTCINEDQEFLDTYYEYEELLRGEDENNECSKENPWILRFMFNREKMLEKKINMIDIYNKINTKMDKTLTCIYSDDNSSNLIMRIRLNVTNEEDVEYNDDVGLLSILEKQLMNTLIRGIQNIEKVNMFPLKQYVYNPDSEDEPIGHTEIWALDTTGTNLKEILANENIDSNKTTSNDIREILEVLGVEAARESIVREFTEVISKTAFVNYRHIGLLADTMTNKGFIMSIDRYGINKSEKGPLTRSSFEETVDQLMRAAAFAENDNLKGVTASVMMGQMISAGTGECNIVLDAEQLENIEEEKEEEEGDMNEILSEINNLVDIGEKCEPEMFESNFNIQENKIELRPVNFDQDILEDFLN